MDKNRRWSGVVKVWLAIAILQQQSLGRAGADRQAAEVDVQGNTQLARRKWDRVPWHGKAVLSGAKAVALGSSRCGVSSAGLPLHPGTF